MATTLLVGTDPEFMLRDKSGNLKSAIGVVKGTKEAKLDLGGGCSAFPDNVNCEVNIAPANSAAGLVENVRNCLHRLSKAVAPYTVSLTASAEYPKKECEHPDAKVFGCEPEYDAYKLEIVQAPTCETTFRSAGGHIHLGYTENKYPLMAPVDGEDGGLERAFGRVWVVRMMDLFVGLPSLWIDQDPSSPARRKLYGRAGTHRPKEEYGVEYRPTGNFWLRSPATVTLTYNLAKFVVDFVAERGHEKFWKGTPDEGECFGYDADKLQASINNSDKKAGAEFLNGIVKKHLPAKLFSDILAASEPETQTLHQAWGI